MIFECRDYSGRLVRLSEKTLAHILAKRPWMVNHLEALREALESPEAVLEGARGELLSFKWFDEILGGAFLAVVYRPLDREGFIITAYPTKAVNKLYRRRRIVWRRR